MLRTVVKIAGATIAFSLLHSLFASRAVKSAVGKQIGERNRNGLYRPFYMLQSVVSLGALAVYSSTLPNKTLYQTRGRVALLMRAGQLLSIVAMAHTTHRIGILRFSGLPNLLAWLSGKQEIAPEPEGQGPTQENSGTMQTGGLFHVSRHPLNLLPLPLIWLQPRMTVRWATFSTVASLYFFLGSFHEEGRLRARYGRAYKKYEYSGIGFYFPHLPRVKKDEK